MLSDFSNLHIIIIDDSATGRMYMTDMLEELGHKVDAFSNGPEAVEALQNSSHDLILCDLVMPGMDGLQVFREIRSQGIEIPFLLITAHASLESAVEALRLGADDYISQPVAPKLLTHRIESAMSRHLLEKEKAENRMLEAALATAGAVSHEANQPLTILLASAELIAVTHETEKIKKLAATIGNQAQRLGDIIHRVTRIIAFRTKPYIDDNEMMDLNASTKK